MAFNTKTGYQIADWVLKNQPSGEVHFYLWGKVICMCGCLCSCDKCEPSPTPKWFAMCFKCACVRREGFYDNGNYFSYTREREREREQSSFQLLSVHWSEGIQMGWFYISWENSCDATMLYRGPGEVQGLSPKTLFFFVSPRSSLTRQSCLCLRPQTETIFKLFYLQLPAFHPPGTLLPGQHPNVVVFTCLPHFLIFDFRHSDPFHAAHCWSKWSFSPPLLPLFPMTIKGQKYASWPPHLPCIFSIHSHSPSFQQLPIHICPHSYPF